MPNVPNVLPDSYSPTLVEIILSAGSGTQAVPLQLDFLESFTVRNVTKGAWVGTLVLFDRSGDFLLQLLTAAGSDRRIIMRWGWDDGRGLEQYPQYIGDYAKFTPEFTAEGTRLTFELIAATAYEQVLDKRTRSFEANTRISDVVVAIADSRGWRTEDAKGRPTIEATKSRLTEPLVQRGESDFEFIVKRLLKRAVNPNGKGNYYFFFDEDEALHFHTYEFIRAGNQPEYAAEYIFGQAGPQFGGGEVISFTPSDLNFFQFALGTGATVHWGIDSLNGVRLRLASTDIGGVPGAQNVVDSEASHMTQVLTRKLRKAKNLFNRVKAIIARTPEDFESKVRSHFDKLRDKSYPAEMQVRGTHAVKPGDRVKVNYFTTNAQEPHYLSGAFFVKAVEHEFSSGSWTTSFELQRSAVSETGDSLPLDAAQKQKATSGPNTQHGGIGNPRSRAGKSAAKERRGASA